LLFGVEAHDSRRMGSYLKRVHGLHPLWVAPPVEPGFSAPSRYDGRSMFIARNARGAAALDRYRHNPLGKPSRSPDVTRGRDEKDLIGRGRCACHGPMVPWFVYPTCPTVLDSNQERTVAVWKRRAYDEPMRSAVRIAGNFATEGESNPAAGPWPSPGGAYDERMPRIRRRPHIHFPNSRNRISHSISLVLTIRDASRARPMTAHLGLAAARAAWTA
jgi:hypothetical protein